MKIATIEAIPVRLFRNREDSRRSAGSPTALAEGEAAYRWSTTVPALYSTYFETALIKITLDGGLVGWGEAQAPLAPEVACTIVDRLLQPVLIGAEFNGSPGEIADLWERMYRTMRVRGQTGGFMLDAISGVDIALWDLAGKIAGLPLASLLSRKPGFAVQAYLSGVTGATLSERAETARERKREGFQTFKLFYESTVEELLATFDAVQAAVGEDAGIAVDALWRLETDSALPFAAELDKRNALWLEAPLGPEDAGAHAELAARIRTPLALGESYRTRFEMAAFFRANALRVAQPDIGRTGITEGERIAKQARDHGASIVPHVSIALGPQIAAAIHFAAATPGCDLLEYNPNVLAVANEYLKTPLQVLDAKYVVPSGPGLGIEVREHELRCACIP